MLFRPVLAKIQLPPRPQKLLSRPRLLDFLSEYADVKLMAISATAGYGKTSLLVDHAHTAEMPVCWYALDRFDRDPGTFFAHLLASIRLQFPDFGQQSETTLASFQNPARDWLVLAATLVNELYETIPEYFTIVLDDYHHIENVIPINEFLAYLLQYSDEHCHLIVASRRLPRLPNQALLFGRGQMEGLDTIGLRFTAQEIQALAKQNYNLDLPPGKATELAKHFEGWITGILLTAHPGWTKLLGDAAQLRTGEHVYDYLAEQVFADQPPDVQDFLLESAILNRMSAETLDALRETDDSAVMLAQASNRNLFLVSLDDENRFSFSSPSTTKTGRSAITNFSVTFCITNCAGEREDVSRPCTAVPPSSLRHSGSGLRRLITTPRLVILDRWCGCLRQWQKHCSVPVAGTRCSTGSKRCLLTLPTQTRW
jgi:LuxR family maltose regulon positive regulatory protein